VTADLISRAQAGDDAAFALLVDPYRRELQVHCYRMLGSLQDAEDVLQETLLAAWRGFPAFEGRATVRTWLYRIATNRCLNAQRSASRMPPTDPRGFDMDILEPTRFGEVPWLQPYPDALLDQQPEPSARIESREAISLAFVTALQLLPPLQRSVLVLRDVLGFRASEVAVMLDTTEDSVTSALTRARAALERKIRFGSGSAPPPPPGSAVERELVERLTTAYESGDLDTIVGLMTDDVWLTMPPLPLEYQGRELAGRFLRAVAFRPDRRFRVVATRANGHPAFGFYDVDPMTGVAHANGILVLNLSGDRVNALVRFDSTVLAQFGLPTTLRE
jgi:RNA polymerase sigma-70 factor, ECF subfamily